MSETTPELILSQKEAQYYRKLFEQRASQLVNAEFEVSKLRRDVKRTNLSLSLIAELNKRINVEDSFENAVEVGLKGMRSSLELDAAFYIELYDGKVQKVLSSGCSDEEVKKLEKTNFPDMKFDIEESGIIVRDAPHESQELSTLSKIISLPYFILIPLLSDNSLVGLLIAGRKIEKVPYAPILDEQDRVVLFTLGSWITSMLKDQLIMLNKTAKETAEEASKSKSEFLANMSHEIRTPMTGLLGFIDQLSKTEKDPNRVEKFKIARASGETLLDIINDILDFSKIESGKLTIESYPLNIKELFNNISKIFTQIASAKNINIINTMGKNIPSTILGDETRLKQVLFNLINNAIKFTQNGGNVTMHMYYNAERSTLHFSVMDTGIGIAKDNLDKIFQAFSQEDISTTRKFGGTGLGLSISSRLVSLMGGELKVESKVGKGSKFYFELPIEISLESMNNDDISTEDAQESATTDQIKAHVLVVEDNKTNQMLMSMILDDLGVTYDIANDGAEGVFKTKLNSYDIILMDENMPIMNGIEATKTIRENEQETQTHIPIIAVTANALTGDREKFVDAGMDDYISKPYTEEDIVKILQKYLG